MGLTQVNSGGISDDSIVNADINSAANIASTKLAKPIDLADNEKVRFGTSADLEIYHDGSNSIIHENGTGHLHIRADGALKVQTSAGTETKAEFHSDGAADLYYDNSKKFATKSDGVDVTGELQCDSLDVDGAADFSGAVTLHSNLNMGDADTIRLGDANDLQIYHNGTNSFIDNNAGDLYIRGNGDDLFLRSADDIFIQPNGNDNGITVNGSGSVELYHNSSKKLETTSGGVEITGSATATTVLFDNTNAGIYFGTSGAFGPNPAIGRAQQAGYHSSGSAQGDLVIGAERQQDILFGTTTSSTGGLLGRCRITDAGHFEPVDNNSFDLGSSSKRWRNVYTNDLNLSNEGSANDVDGTWGNYTIQEGEDDLFLINRRNGKKYKFNLTEVS